MGLHKDYDENQMYANLDVDENEEDLPHRKRVRRLLEDRLERRRLKHELEDFDGELDADFDWDEIDR